MMGPVSFASVTSKAHTALLLFAAAVPLLACAPAPFERAIERMLDPVNNIDPEQPVTLGPDEGLIVGTVTAPMVQHYWEVSSVHYRRQGESAYGQLKSASPVSDAFGRKDRPVEPGGTGPDWGLKGSLGRAFAIRLPAGGYEVFRIVYGHSSLELPPATFEVRAGEIVYLGNLNVQYCLYAPPKRTYRGHVHGAIPNVRDRVRSDLPLLMRKFPVLEELPISTSIIDDQRWRGLPLPVDATCP